MQIVRNLTSGLLSTCGFLAPLYSVAQDNTASQQTNFVEIMLSATFRSADTDEINIRVPITFQFTDDIITIFYNNETPSKTSIDRYNNGERVHTTVESGKEKVTFQTFWAQLLSDRIEVDFDRGEWNYGGVFAGMHLVFAMKYDDCSLFYNSVDTTLGIQNPVDKFFGEDPQLVVTYCNWSTGTPTFLNPPQPSLSEVIYNHLQ